MGAFADFEFIPRKSASRYDWATTDWKSGGSYVTSLPTKSDLTWITATLIRNSTDGIFINSGTDAEVKKFYLANSNTNSRPMKLTIDGGSLTAYDVAYIGQKSPGILTLQNGGTLVAKSNTYIGLHNTSTDSSQPHVFDAKLIIADPESSFTAANTVYMGHQRGGTSLLDNKGTVSITGTGKLQLGVWTNVVEQGDIVSIITNSGTLSVASDALIGYRTNNVGRVENTGNLTIGGDCLIAREDYSEGCLCHSAGNLSIVGSVYVGYRGKGYLELAGDTETVFPGGSFALARNDWNNTIHSIGELVITNNASLSRGGKSLIAAINRNATARIALYDNAKLSDLSLLYLGNSTTDNSFEVYDNAVVSNVNLLVLNVGHTSTGAGTTRMKVSGNAKVCDLQNAYVGSNSYNHAELEIADNVWFGLRDDAWDTNRINVARDSMKSGDATIRLRGGAIGLGIRGGLVLGSTNNNVNVACTSRLVGYGCVTNQGDSSRTLWSRIDVRGGSVTADGEGVERDLDLRTFARISGHANEGRSNLNVSGTNGWYAINKGRLCYPARDPGEYNKDTGVNSRPRFVGDYARLAASTVPKYVNSMRIIPTDSSGIELTSARCLFVELYAPDRTDIPAGLVEDGEESLRLGVWRGCIAQNYANASRRDFTTAETTIRYDQWRLFGLKDGNGNYPEGLQIRLYQYDGTSWKRVTGYSAAEAESNGYRISGTLYPVSGVYNLGWFAVVAKCNKTGTAIVIR
ncbi:MAG: hypothetical protein IJH50_13400 [Kiritimatiellae bacterium]|nr:hypothetical protein [Kiritimatiellia bacterium]